MELNRFACLCVLACTLVTPAVPLAAQAPLFVAGFAGGSFDADDAGPNGGGGGFAYQGDAGVRFAHFMVGGELARHATGGDRRATIYGGFVRFLSAGDRPIQAYLVAGIGSYRFSPAQGETSALGGSIGPGVVWRLNGRHAGLMFEVRYHSTFDRLAGIANQQFVSVLAGLQLGL